MQIVDLKVGDIVKLAGDSHRYLVTALKKNGTDLVTLMGCYGSFDSVDAMFVEKVEGYMSIDYIFMALFT